MTDFAELRELMVRDQIASRGIHDARVLNAMRTVPREEFVPTDAREWAYTDNALPIELGQTISQPYTVAFMCQAARLLGPERVLEIGTGSGYGAAVLSRLASEVVTVERLPQLATTAANRLARLGFNNVHVHIADGTEGWKSSGPYDAIIVTAAAIDLPPNYPEQLTMGGRIIIPIGPPGGRQTMFRFTRTEQSLEAEELGTFAFVPLIGNQDE